MILAKSSGSGEAPEGTLMYRLESIIRNYGLKLLALQAGDSRQEGPGTEIPEPFMTPRTRQVIEQRISVQIRRRLIRKALEEA